MNTYLETRWGGGPTNPTEEELLRALKELETNDPEHPDCWLVDDNEWVIAASEGGRMTLENPETDEGPWHINNCSPDFVLDAWKKLKEGRIEDIRALDWQEGYGAR